MCADGTAHVFGICISGVGLLKTEEEEEEEERDYLYADDGRNQEPRRRRG